MRIDDRVVARRRLRQAGQHRDLGQIQVAQIFSEIDLGGRREAVGALAEIDLVDVELEDLVLGQAVLDLEGEQRFVELARERLLRGQEEVARHLHGDGGGALPALPAVKLCSTARSTPM